MAFRNRINYPCHSIACILAFIGLVGCGGGNMQPVPIVSINQGVSTQKQQDISPVITASIKTQSQIKSQTQPQIQVNNAESKKIIYNRNYNSISKGSYTADTYTVKPGDTLFYIAWIAGKDYRDLATDNNIGEPYNLTVGQQLTLGNSVSQPGQTTVSNPLKQNVTKTVDSVQGKAYAGADKNENKSENSVLSPARMLSVPPQGQWKWPTHGKIIENYSANEGGNKGIDITGKKGQPVLATASGKVVYAGNALRGYGNLIIIKHNDDYLSAYAHNDKILVQEGQDVTTGQEIATMGNTGASSVRLHFEIRYKGKSVNPLRYLSQR